MRNFILSLSVVFFSIQAFGQLYNDGGVIFISSGGLVHAETNVHNTNSGTVTNNGTLTTTSDFENSGSGITDGDGDYNIHGNWNNTATYNSGTSTVNLTDAGNTVVTSGGDSFHDLEVSKTAGNNVILQDEMTVSNSLSWTSDNNKILLGNNNLVLESSATVSGNDANDYVVTGGTGEMVKEGLTSAFTYPVGYNASTYNPVTITQAGTADDLGVRAMENMLDAGMTGAPLTDDAVDASWVISEGTAGGSNVTVAPEWATSDELGTFDRAQSVVYRYDGSDWTSDGAPLTAATGSNPYSQTRSGITTLGVFAIGGSSLQGGILVDVSVFLEGPYAGSGTMDDDLRAGGDIPTTEPFTGLANFTHVNDGGGETVMPAVLAVTGNNAIVDWVFLEVRDATTLTTVISTRSGLLQADGDVVDVDGTSPVEFTNLQPGSYYVVVNHRNHLEIMTPGALPLSRTPYPHDFTTGAAYGNLSGNVQKNLGGGEFGMYEGDVNNDGVINASDRSMAWNFRNQTGYLNTDSNLDGVTNAGDRSQIWNNRNLFTAVP